ncbi:MAG: hypothetical protein WAS55_14160 [Saprospiraceae bacterium]
MKTTIKSFQGLVCLLCNVKLQIINASAHLYIWIGYPVFSSLKCIQQIYKLKSEFSDSRIYHSALNDFNFRIAISYVSNPLNYLYPSHQQIQVSNYNNKKLIYNSNRMFLLMKIKEHSI